MRFDLPSFIDHVNKSPIASIRTITGEIIRLLADSTSTLARFKEVIELDPSLTSQLLKHANSASMYSKREIGDVEQAVLWLGLGKLKELALNQSLCGVYKGQVSVHGFSRFTLWKHSVAVAHFMKIIFQRDLKEAQGLAYSTGLLHDLGLIIMDQLLPDSVLDVLDRMRETGQDMCACEKQVFGFDHRQVGQAVAIEWELPAELARCLGHHDAPYGCQTPPDRLLLVTYLADQVCSANGLGFQEAHPREDTVFGSCCNDLGLSPSTLQLALDETIDILESLEELGYF